MLAPMELDRTLASYLRVYFEQPPHRFKCVTVSRTANIGRKCNGWAKWLRKWRMNEVDQSCKVLRFCKQNSDAKDFCFKPSLLKVAFKRHLHSCHLYCCDRNSRAACTQIFTLCQQATKEITHSAHSIIACSRHMYMGAILRAHPIRGDSHIQRNADREVATVLYLVSCNVLQWS